LYKLKEGKHILKVERIVDEVKEYKTAKEKVTLKNADEKNAIREKMNNMIGKD